MGTNNCYRCGKEILIAELPTKNRKFFLAQGKCGECLKRYCDCGNNPNENLSRCLNCGERVSHI